MEKLIKTENARDFIANYLVGCSHLKESRSANLILTDEIIVSDKADLKTGDSIKIEVQDGFNTRCSLTQVYVYDITEYDSVSVKGFLRSYSIVPIYNN